MTGAPTLGDPVKALARCGDPRAVPVLAQVLAGPVVPDDLGRAVVHLGSAGAPLAPALRHRLGGVALDSPEMYDRAAPLLSALGALGDAEAVPEVLRLLLGASDGRWLREAAVRALEAFGAAAREAIPALRGLLDTESAVAAAVALWSVEGDASAVLPVLMRELASEGYGRRAAADALARLGPPARAALPELCRMAGSDDLWERTAAACALWRIGGDPELAAPVLRAAWEQSPHTRRTVAACVVALGPAGEPLHDLLRAELASPRRHKASSGGYGSHDIVEDLELLRVCREGVGDL